MIRYCFLTSGSWTRNASAFRLRELGSALCEEGFDVGYIVDDRPEHREGLGLHPDAWVGYVAGAESPAQLIERRRALRRVRPDVVHVLNPLPKLCLALAGTRYVVVGDWDEWPSQRPHGPARRLLELHLDRWLRRRAAMTVVASRHLQDRFRELHSLNSLYLPYATLRNPYDDGESPFEAPTGVYMGNLYPAYDHDLLFEAAALLAKRGARPRLQILGGGPDLERWRRFVADRGLSNLDVVGYVEGAELWRRLRHAHVLLLPIRETTLNLARCPMKTYSYAQARRPVIANAVGEVVSVLGAAAEYVEATPEALAAAIAHAFAVESLPDVDYGVQDHTWSRRARTLAVALNSGVLPDHGPQEIAS